MSKYNHSQLLIQLLDITDLISHVCNLNFDSFRNSQKRRNWQSNMSTGGNTCFFFAILFHAHVSFYSHEIEMVKSEVEKWNETQFLSVEYLIILISQFYFSLLKQHYKLIKILFPFLYIYIYLMEVNTKFDDFLLLIGTCATKVEKLHQKYENSIISFKFCQCFFMHSTITVTNGQHRISNFILKSTKYSIKNIKTISWMFHQNHPQNPSRNFSKQQIDTVDLFGAKNDHLSLDKLNEVFPFTVHYKQFFNIR